MPVVGTPHIWPLSSNDTSTVGGSVERTRLTSLLPLVSPICSPSINQPLFSPGFGLGIPACAILPPLRIKQFDKYCISPKVVVAHTSPEFGNRAWMDSALGRYQIPAFGANVQVRKIREPEPRIQRTGGGNQSLAIVCSACKRLSFPFKANRKRWSLGSATGHKVQARPALCMIGC